MSPPYPRLSGPLLHPSCLPGPFGIGDLGPAARRFAQHLHDCGQRLWQVLPWGPPDGQGSPYASDSGFAGNALLISPEDLVHRGLLDPDALDGLPPSSPGRVDYAAAAALKQPWLQQACENFPRRAGREEHLAFEAFRERHTSWLEPYALYRALKNAHQDRPWWQWGDYVQAHTPAVTRAARHLRAKVDVHRFSQYVFFRQWQALRDDCHALGIRLIGDLPLYVAHDSAEVWAQPHWFQMQGDGTLDAVAGVPPDYFSASGQRWGNPLYHWPIMAEDGYGWWTRRLQLHFEGVDILRLDHFRGYQAYWEVPAEATTTRNGRWQPGPGKDLFDTVLPALNRLGLEPQFIAEDLGVITADVDTLRESLDFPRTLVLQMAFGNDPLAPQYLPHHHIANAAVYTATHDHNTTRGWFESPPGSQTNQSEQEVLAERRAALDYIGSDGRHIHWDMIRLALQSPARYALFPLQDVMGLSSEARMNLPGTCGGGNWRWRFSWENLKDVDRERLADLTRAARRG